MSIVRNDYKIEFWYFPGHVGVVQCLDSSPEVLRVLLYAYLGNLTDTPLPDAIDDIDDNKYKLTNGHKSAEIKNGLTNIEEWNDNDETCINRLKE